MARPLRIIYPDAWYHVMNRGRSRVQIYREQDDYFAFVELLREASAMWKVRIAAYCLMSNHYHLLIQTPGANLSRFMRHLNGIYTQYFNRTYKSDGPLFRGRYKSIVVESDSYLLELVRYIHRNPLQAGLVKRLEDYRWSSHRMYISRGNEINWLHKEYVLSMLEADKQKRRQAYIDFIKKEEEAEMLSKIYNKGKLPLLLGTKEFIDRIRHKYQDKTNIKDTPQVRELFQEKSKVEKAVSSAYQVKVEDLKKSRRGNYNEARNVAIYLMRKHTGASLSDIGSRFEMRSYSSVSSVVQRMQEALRRNINLRQRVEEAERLLT
ncbi:MAG: transposase [Deltaproteobacteria bacterium]|nr:transposase [Deltaproteobacteria bacterium]